PNKVEEGGEGAVAGAGGAVARPGPADTLANGQGSDAIAAAAPTSRGDREGEGAGAADAGGGRLDGVGAGREIEAEPGVEPAAAIVVLGEDGAVRAVAALQIEVRIRRRIEVDAHARRGGEREGVVPGIAAGAVVGGAGGRPGAGDRGVRSDERLAGGGGPREDRQAEQQEEEQRRRSSSAHAHSVRSLPWKRAPFSGVVLPAGPRKRPAKPNPP